MNERENYRLASLTQFTVKPDVTPEEVKAVDDEQGGQIFSQAVRTDIFISQATCSVGPTAQQRYWFFFFVLVQRV